jgi:hypothetical protein
MKYLIISSSFEEAEFYMRNNNLNRLDCSYIGDKYRLLGLNLKKYTIVFTGTFYRRNDLKEIKCILYCRDCKENIIYDDDGELRYYNKRSYNNKASLADIIFEIWNKGLLSNKI